MNEADTCRKFVVPKLQAAGWDDRPHAINEQKSFTDGRVVFVGGKARRGKQKRSDYLLRYNPDFPIAVVEGRCCTTLTVEDSQRESMRLDGLHEQAIPRPLPHDKLVQLHCLALQARFAVDLAGQGHDLALAA